LGTEIETITNQGGIKMNSKSIFHAILMFLLLVSVVVAVTTTAQAKKPVILRLSSALPPQDIVVVKAKEMAERFNKGANGSYIMEIHPGGTLSSLEDTFTMLRAGAIEMAESPIEYQSGSDIRFAAVTLPFLVNSLDANIKFLKLINESLFNKIIAEKFNAMPLIVMSTGIHEYCGTKKPVRTISDWKGLLVWVANPVEANTVQALGASPVNLTFFDGYPALEKGTVDAGVGVNPTGVWNFKWYEAIRNITVSNMFGTSGYIYINLDVFNKMPKEIQNLLLAESQRCEKELTEFLTQYAKDSLVELEKAGVNVYYLTDSERAKWIEASRPVIEKFYSQIGPEDAKKIEDAAREANK
jgi:TRAP-type C4-dicarboxylate transport system substrate-binding protein